MSSATTARLYESATAPLPARVTLPMSANSLYPMGTIVGRTSAGRAYAYTDADASGNPAMGVCNATYDNRTTNFMGLSGLDDAEDVEACAGPFAFPFTGTTPIPGDPLYVVDNQTLSTDSNGGTRGFAGICSEVREDVAGTAVAFCVFSPVLIPLAATRSEQAQINIPLNSFRIASSGAAVAAFAAGTTDGFDPTAESMGIRWNDDSTVAFATTVALPQDLDDAQPVVIHALGYRVGAADPTAALTFAAFFHTVGAAFSADADAGGASSAFAAATTVVSEVTATLAAVDVPAAPCSLNLSMVPTAALDDDDLVVTAVWLEYTRKVVS